MEVELATDDHEAGSPKRSPPEVPEREIEEIRNLPAGRTPKPGRFGANASVKRCPIPSAASGRPSRAGVAGPEPRLRDPHRAYLLDEELDRREPCTLSLYECQ